LFNLSHCGAFIETFIGLNDIEIVLHLSAQVRSTNSTPAAARTSATASSTSLASAASSLALMLALMLTLSGTLVGWIALLLLSWFNCRL